MQNIQHKNTTQTLKKRIQIYKKHLSILKIQQYINTTITKIIIYKQCTQIIHNKTTIIYKIKICKYQIHKVYTKSYKYILNKYRNTHILQKTPRKLKNTTNTKKCPIRTKIRKYKYTTK